MADVFFALSPADRRDALDVAAAQLIHAGRLVAVRPKACLVLAALAARPRELVSKDALLDAVWGRCFITEGVIKSAVGELRTALADDPRLPSWIETVPRRGYRYIGPVDVVGPPSDPRATPPAMPYAPLHASPDAPPP